MIKLLTIFLLVPFLGAAQVLKSFKVANVQEYDLVNAGFEIRISDVKSPFILVSVVSDESIPYQLDDLDGDGKAETMFFQTNLPALISRQFMLKKTDTVPVFEKRAQIVFKHQPEAFDTANPKKITGGYVTEQKMEVPQNISPQNYWFKNEGPTWENDYIGYRFYADARHRFDIFGKKTPKMVLDTIGPEYHDVLNWGADILKVGDALGMAAPAFWSDGRIIPFSEWDSKTIEIVANGPLRSIFKTTFKNLKAGNNLLIGRNLVDLEQTIEFRAGERFCDVRLNILKTTHPYIEFCTGIVKHPSVQSMEIGIAHSNFFGYTYGKQSYHGDGLGMAVLIKGDYNPVRVDDSLTYAVRMRMEKKEICYRFLASWALEPNGAKTAQEFEKMVFDAMRHEDTRF
jgi:Domain of unknown function (DUF4861)